MRKKIPLRAVARKFSDKASACNSNFCLVGLVVIPVCISAAEIFNPRFPCSHTASVGEFSLMTTNNPSKSSDQSHVKNVFHVDTADKHEHDASEKTSSEVEKLAGRITRKPSSTGIMIGRNAVLKSLIFSCLRESIRATNMISASFARSEVWNEVLIPGKEANGWRN